MNLHTHRRLYGVSRSKEEKSLVARTAGMDYAISVLHDDNKLNLGDRSYIFQGGTMTINNDAGGSENVPWCFEYGEADWKSGSGFNLKLIKTRGDVLADPVIKPVGRVDCTTGEGLDDA